MHYVLCFFLYNKMALAYPESSSSTGSNPIFAFGGTTAASATSTLATAPSDQRMIITDIVLTISGQANYTPCINRINIQTDAGNKADFVLVSDTNYNDYYLKPTQVSHSYRSGIPVNPGEILGITNHGSTCTISYSLSGYYAKP